MGHDDEDDKVKPLTEKIGGIAAAMAVFLTLVSGIYIYSQSVGANSVTLQNHTTQIAAIQAEMNNEQVTLVGISTQLATITQKLDDMETEGHK